MAHPVPDDIAAQIRAAILAGKKIAAIKLYRAATGVGLKEAKDFIEAVQAELWQTEPDAFTSSAKKGCGSMAVAIALLIAILTVQAGRLAWAQSAEKPPASHLVAIVGEKPIHLDELTPVDTKVREQFIADVRLNSRQPTSW